MADFYIPRFKHELVSFLKQQYPGKNWNSCSKKQLYAVYFSIRRN